MFRQVIILSIPFCKHLTNMILIIYLWQFYRLLSMGHFFKTKFKYKKCIFLQGN
jgi:hypothetical protein